ncbi:MAG TPA: SDR family NAD(P)-dependent oxidoreductase [Acidimicrobiales bacterium]
MPIDDSPVPDYGQLLRLDGRVFVVGGAGFGMGRRVAHALASQGASVLCIDVIEDRATTVADEIGGIACVADLRVADDVERSIATAEGQFGRLNGVVDIVGGARWSSIVNMTEADWDGTLDENLRHVFLMIKFGAPALKRAGGGSIAFVSSMSGTTSSPFHGAYGAAKAGIVSLVRSAAAELRRDNIRVNSVAPGATATPRMVEATGETSDGTLTGWGAPSDIAAALLFLSSDLARHVSGQTFLVDGATTAEYPQELPASLTGQP